MALIQRNEYDPCTNTYYRFVYGKKFYFSIFDDAWLEVEPVNKPKEPKMSLMNHTLSVFLLPNVAVRAVLCTYTDIANDRHKEVIFKTFDTTIAKDDLVVVPTKERVHATVVKVKEVDVDVDMSSSVPMDWIIQKVDQETYKGILAQEDTMVKKVKAVEKAQQRKQLLASLDMPEEDIKAISFSPVINNTANTGEAA